jgi:hypothetical protein
MRGHGCRSSTPAAAGAPYVDAAELAGKLMPPAVLALVNVKQAAKRLARMSAPKGLGPWHSRLFSLQISTF